MSPEVSVVVPTHNRRELLALTLRTVCEQKDVDLEVIVIDDGSTEEAARDVVRARQDPRIRLLRNAAAMGVSTSRNRGVEEAAGRWVAFCDDDDLWAPQKLREQLRAAEQARRSWVYVGAVKIDDALRIIGGEPPQPPDVVHRRLPRWTLVPGGCSGVIARRDLVRDVGGFDPALVNLADWDLWSRLAGYGPPAAVPLPLVGYRIHGGNASQDTSLVLREVDRLDGRYGVRVDRAAVHHYLAWVSLRGGRRRQASRHFLQAAARGDVRGVATSVSILAMRRLPGRARPLPHAEWWHEADRWLEPLRCA
jgi:glycosyltransferase involved in cell wall biosynthesis